MTEQYSKYNVSTKSSKLYAHIRKYLSNASVGKNNPMYGKKLRDYMSPEKYKLMLEKRRKTITGKKLLQKNINGKIIKRSILKS